jgi:hypothetical protein
MENISTAQGNSSKKGEEFLLQGKEGAPVLATKRSIHFGKEEEMHMFR